MSQNCQLEVLKSLFKKTVLKFKIFLIFTTLDILVEKLFSSLTCHNSLFPIFSRKFFIARWNGLQLPTNDWQQHKHFEESSPLLHKTLKARSFVIRCLAGKNCFVSAQKVHANHSVWAQILICFRQEWRRNRADDCLISISNTFGEKATHRSLKISTINPCLVNHKKR